MSQKQSLITDIFPDLDFRYKERNEPEKKQKQTCLNDYGPEYCMNTPIPIHISNNQCWFVPEYKEKAWFVKVRNQNTYRCHVTSGFIEDAKDRGWLIIQGNNYFILHQGTRRISFTADSNGHVVKTILS